MRTRTNYERAQRCLPSAQNSYINISLYWWLAAKLNERLRAHRTDKVTVPKRVLTTSIQNKNQHQIQSKQHFL